MNPINHTISRVSEALGSPFRRLLGKPARRPYNHDGPPLHPYDPDEFPLALSFARDASKDPAAEPAFIATLTWLGGRCQLLEVGEIPQQEAVGAHKRVYGGGEGGGQVGWEEVGWAATLEVWKGMAVEKKWVVRDRSEFIGRCLGECWRVLDAEGKWGEGRQEALDSAAWLAVKFWKRWRKDSRKSASAVAARGVCDGYM